MIHRGDSFEIEIVEYAFGGRGIGYLVSQEKKIIVFVDNTFPGQVVLCRISKIRKNYAEAKLIDIVQRSKCEVINDFQEVSGSPYIYVPNELQKDHKIKSTLSTFKKISGAKEDLILDEYIDSPMEYFYRNKMEYSFSSIEFDKENKVDIDDAFALGFKRRGTWWKVENLDKPSGLFDEEFEKKLIQVRSYLKKCNLPAWHPPQKKGFFRHLVVRKSFYHDHLLLNIVTSSEQIKLFDKKSFVDFVVKILGNRVRGILHTINDDVSDRSKIENGQSELLFGKPFIIEEINGLKFQISMESFFQTNPKGAENLYNKAISYLFEQKYQEEEVIMDLFCGTGTIGQLIAAKNNSISVIGVDIVPEAIDDAKKNAGLNKLKNIKFHASDVGKFLKEKPEYIGKISSIIIDPPRAGIAPKTLLKIKDLDAKTIVYISCNPSTQARDAATLREFGYSLEKYTLVNQFPHTGHIESIGKFVKHEH